MTNCRSIVAIYGRCFSYICCPATSHVPIRRFERVHLIHDSIGVIRSPHGVVLCRPLPQIITPSLLALREGYEDIPAALLRDRAVLLTRHEEQLLGFLA